MRKYKRLILVIFVMVVVVSGVRLKVCNDALASIEHEFATFYTHSADSFYNCEFYDPDNYFNYDTCDASYGYYDSANRKLVLGSGINNKPNGEVIIKLEEVTISSNGDIASCIYNQNKPGNVILDFGNYSFTDILLDDSNYGSLFGNNLVINSGTINVSEINEVGSVGNRGNLNNLMINGGTLNAQKIINVNNSLEIKGGTINIGENVETAISVKDSLRVSGGTINIPRSGIAFYGNDTASMNVSGGVINAENIGTSGISNMNDIQISGGEVKLTSDDSADFGINTSNKSFSIDGGNLTVDGFDYGINGNNGKIYFNGGTTVVKNSKTRSIWINPAQDPENDIVFGEGMGIKEDTYVFYDDTSTGIADPDVVTITDGYSYRRRYGWETIDKVDKNSSFNSSPKTSSVDNKSISRVSDSSNESSLKVPDTGMFSVENGGVMMAMISVGALAAVAGAAYSVSYTIKRCKSSVRFNK